MTQGSWPEERTVHTIRDLEPSGSRESEEVLGSAAEHLEAGREQRLRGSQEWMPEADSTFSFQVKVSSPGGGISDAAPSGRGQAWGQRSLARAPSRCVLLENCGRGFSFCLPVCLLDPCEGGEGLTLVEFQNLLDTCAPNPHCRTQLLLPLAQGHRARGGLCRSRGFVFILLSCFRKTGLEPRDLGARLKGSCVS